MGRCIKCGLIYCSCPENGICDSCLAKMQIKTQTGNGVVISSPDCSVTSADIEQWQKRMMCAQGMGFGDRLQANTIQSYVESAWNYRDRPCMFKQFLPEIEAFMQLLDINNICTN